MKNSSSIVSSDKSDPLSTLHGDIASVNPEVAKVLQRAELTDNLSDVSTDLLREAIVTGEKHVADGSCGFTRAGFRQLEIENEKRNDESRHHHSQDATFVNHATSPAVTAAADTVADELVGSL